MLQESNWIDERKRLFAEAKAVVSKNFPHLWVIEEACLAAISTLYIQGKDPASLVLIGESSSGKGTTLSSFKDHPITFWIDDFTPAAFVSSADKDDDELERLDILTMIKGKVWIIPELAPTLNQRHEDLHRIIAILTKIFDGEPYTRGTGYKFREIKGRYRFTFLAATTHPEDKFWKLIGKLGNRLTFIQMPEPQITCDDLVEELLHNEEYLDKLEENRIVVSKLLDHLKQVGIIKWDRRNDSPGLVRQLAGLAIFSGKLRGYIPTNCCSDGTYKKGIPEIEIPHRTPILLYNLMRGRALINGRLNVDSTDLELIKEIILSSCSRNRNKVIRLLLNNGGTASTAEIMINLKCDIKVALDVMEDLTILDVVVRDKVSEGKGYIIKIKEEYMNLFRD